MMARMVRPDYPARHPSTDAAKKILTVPQERGFAGSQCTTC
jgi:hypothetical protein